MPLTAEQLARQVLMHLKARKNYGRNQSDRALQEFLTSEAHLEEECRLLLAPKQTQLFEPEPAKGPYANG